jgi:hypothetical protein
VCAGGVALLGALDVRRQRLTHAGWLLRCHSWLGFVVPAESAFDRLWRNAGGGTNSPFKTATASQRLAVAPERALERRA